MYGICDVYVIYSRTRCAGSWQGSLRVLAPWPFCAASRPIKPSGSTSCANTRARTQLPRGGDMLRRGCCSYCDVAKGHADLAAGQVRGLVVARAYVLSVAQARSCFNTRRRSEMQCAVVTGRPRE
jgi:hypothetical protein